MKDSDVPYCYFLNTIDMNDLLQSIEYYVKASNLKSRAAVDVFYSVLGNFFNISYKRMGKQMIISRKEEDGGIKRIV